MPFSAPALKKNKILSDVDICGEKQMEMSIIAICTLSDDEYASLLFSQTFFSRCFCLLSESAKGFIVFYKTEKT